MFSAEPLVVELYRKSTDSLEILRVDRGTGESVTLLTQAFVSRDNAYYAPCDERGIAHCEDARIADGKLILTTVPEKIDPRTDGAYLGMGNTEYRSELVALDLATGKEVWRTGIVEVAHSAWWPRPTEASRRTSRPTTTTFRACS